MARKGRLTKGESPTWSAIVTLPTAPYAVSVKLIDLRSGVAISSGGVAISIVANNVNATDATKTDYGLFLAMTAAATAALPTRGQTDVLSLEGTIFLSYGAPAQVVATRRFQIEVVE
jgi:hypothetical protein